MRSMVRDDASQAQNRRKNLTKYIPDVTRSIFRVLERVYDRDRALVVVGGRGSSPASRKRGRDATAADAWLPSKRKVLASMAAGKPITKGGGVGGCCIDCLRRIACPCGNVRFPHMHSNTRNADPQALGREPHGCRRATRRGSRRAADGQRGPGEGPAAEAASVSASADARPDHGLAHDDAAGVAVALPSRTFPSCVLHVPIESAHGCCRSGQAAARHGSRFWSVRGADSARRGTPVM